MYVEGSKTSIVNSATYKRRGGHIIFLGENESFLIGMKMRNL